MASTPQWKVYTAEREYIAACKHVEDAAALLAIQEDGATIRYGHNVIAWTQGADGDAGESYDAVASLAHERMDAHNRKVHARWNAIR